ncbi:unnamed protein product [Rotaria socialis]|uniref:RING-type domain-containing protein n=1 Tax=Rotaria socialis TaxID=392032 RepID=A0A821AYJ4_9BILA|nr:unnamed protein product [Rotaria socialis]
MISHLKRLTFRHIPDVPLNTHRHTISSQFLSVNSQIDSTSLKKPSNKIDELQRNSSTNDVSSILPLPISHISSNHSTLHRSTSLTIDRSSYFSSSSFSSYYLKNDRPISKTLCPICQIPFDIAGVHRPVNDACGHTTCFQCFKTIMIKATGCSLCQKEEELNSQLSDQSYDLMLFFDEWSLDQSSSTRKSLKSIKSFDDNNNDDDDTDFETYEQIAPIDDDEEQCDKATWISADVHDNRPEYKRD